jgi:pantoate--beta-alanine ligase
MTMDRYSTGARLRERLDQARAAGQRVGMVGTSGAMHDGHLSLIRRAVADNDITALFWGGGSASDWMASQVGYDRDAGRDFALAEAAGTGIIYAPASGDLFPRQPMTAVSLPAMAGHQPPLEDPAHLDLIAMTMGKLWNLFGPCRSYFGEKDWQQLVMFQRLADDLAWPVEVIGCPTIREPDGLALSSRNGKLTPDERAQAPVLFQALTAAREAALAGAETSAQLSKVFADVIGDPDRICYFTAVDGPTMRPLDELSGPVRLLASIALGDIRLVDNVGVDLPPAASTAATRGTSAEAATQASREESQP